MIEGAGLLFQQLWRKNYMYTLVYYAVICLCLGTRQAGTRDSGKGGGVILVQGLDYLEGFQLRTAGDSIHRALYGTNCVVIERGVVSRYYKCTGCKVEEAALCVQDLRTNRSHNIAGGCKINQMWELYDQEECCPKYSEGGVMETIGSGYPSTLQCIKDVGCSTSEIYTKMELECNSVCPESTITTPSGGSVCYVVTSDAFRNYSRVGVGIVNIAMVVCQILFFVYL